jgi:hypothetical protein
MHDGNPQVRTPTEKVTLVNTMGYHSTTLAQTCPQANQNILPAH